MLSYQGYALLLIPLFAFAEACVGIGLFVSGAFLVIVASFVQREELVDIQYISLLAMLGAFAGDQLGYYCGRWIGPRFHHMRLVQRYPASIDKAETLIRRYGAGAVFIGRFIPAIRSVIPALLGISQYDRLRYALLDLLACGLWSAALGGILIGLEFAL